MKEPKKPAKEEPVSKPDKPTTQERPTKDQKDEGTGKN
jgi:hypothetical protein